MAREPRPLQPKYRDATAVQAKAGARRSEMEALPADGEIETTQEEKDELRRTVLAASIADRIRLAMDARQSSGIEEIWQQSEDLYNGMEDSSGSAIVKVRGNAARTPAASGRARVILNITKPKTDIGVSRVAEMLVPNDDKPWSIEATPLPDLDDSKVDPNRQLTLADGGQVSARDMAAKIKDEAGVKAEAMSEWIQDGLVECDAYSHMRKQIRNAGRVGTGVLKGPFPSVQKTRKWQVDEATGEMAAVIDTKIVPTSKCIRAQDCFPDPNCGENVHDGADFIERDFITGKALRGMAELPDYDALGIAAALSEGPQVHSKTRRGGMSTRQMAGNMDNDSALYEVFYYYGEVQPEDMLLLGMDREIRDETGALVEGTEGGLTDDEMQLYTIPCVVTMLNARPIKCMVNPMETGSFPYDFFCWDPIDGQPWGRGIPWKMAVAQRMLTASTRQMLENAGLSGAPIVAYMNGVMTPENGVYEIKGRSLWRFEPNEFVKDINHALAVFSIPSMQQELQAIIQFALQMADQLTNLPMLMQGDQQAGTSPETLGGMKLLVQNATSPLRVIAKQHDDQTTKPHLQRWVDWGMEKGPEEIKGDHLVHARGSTALVQREEGREFLMQMFPAMQNPEFRIDPAKFGAELSRSNGYNMKLIQYSDDDWKKKQAEMQANPPPPPPQVMAAQIRAKTESEKLQAHQQVEGSAIQLRTEQEAEDRKLRVMELEIKRETAILDNSTKRGIAIDQVKKELALAAANNRLETMDMQLKLNPANKSGTGIAGGVGDNKP